MKIMERKQKPGESFVSYAWNIYDLYQRLSVVQHIAVIVDRIISNSHVAIRSHLRMLDETKKTMTYLLELERKMAKDLPENHEYFKGSKSSQVQPMVQTTTNQEQPQKTGQANNLKCHKCHKVGHFARNCRQSAILCYTCGLPGHISRNCVVVQQTQRVNPVQQVRRVNPGQQFQRVIQVSSGNSNQGGGQFRNGNVQRSSNQGNFQGLGRGGQASSRVQLLVPEEKEEFEEVQDEQEFV